MADSLQLKKLDLMPDGSVTISWSDGESLSYTNWQQVMSLQGGIDGPSADAKDLIRKLLLGWWLAQDPAAADPALVEGKTMHLDFHSDQILTVI